MFKTLEVSWTGVADLSIVFVTVKYEIMYDTADDHIVIFELSVLPLVTVVEQSF